MTEEDTRKKITNILGDLDLAFSVKKGHGGRTSWTVDLSTADSQVVQVTLMAMAEDDWLYFLYFHNLDPPTDLDGLTQLLRWNTRGDLARIGLSLDKRLVAWTALWKALLTKDLILQSLAQVGRAAEQIR